MRLLNFYLKMTHYFKALNDSSKHLNLQSGHDPARSLYFQTSFISMTEVNQMLKYLSLNSTRHNCLKLG